MKTGNLKLVAVSLSNNCVKIPRCSFCYQMKRTPVPYNWCGVWDALHKVAELKPETVCFEYNGYNLSFAVEYRWFFGKNTNFTMTTMPMLVTETLCGFITKWGVSALAISYDKEKGSAMYWASKAKIAKKAGLKVCCNAMIPKNVDAHSYVINIPPTVLYNCDQLNLLIEKPTGKIKNPRSLQAAILLLKSEVKIPITVDNCLAVQLGYKKDCGAGKEFIHILPNGKQVPCSFGNLCYLNKQKAEKLQEAASKLLEAC